jgi:hypothetical protein
MTREDLEKVRQWASDKLATGEEPPWAWYQYMKLRETLDALIEGQEATTPLGSPESEQRSGTHLRLVANTDPRDTVPRRPAEPPVRLPT